MENRSRKPYAGKKSNAPKINSLNKINFADEAEKVIKSLVTKNKWGNDEIRITTSQVRNLLAMTNELYNQALEERSPQMGESLQSAVQYLKMKVAYAAGRDNTVKDFEKRANLIEHIKEIGTDREKLIIFCRYMESLVAYHKYHGGKNQ